MNFVELVHSLLEDPTERKYFFQVRQHTRLNVLSYFPFISVGSEFSSLHNEMKIRVSCFGSKVSCIH